MKFRCYLIFIFFLTFFVATSLYAQETDVTIDLNTAADIFYIGVGNLTVLAAVQLLKAMFKTSGWGTRILSGVVGYGMTAIYMFTTTGFDLLKFIIFGIVVTLAANGIYLFPKRT